MAHTKYIWDPLSDSVLMEKDENGDTQATNTYLPELYGDLISQRREGDSRYYHFDGQGSTRALTDENEDVTDTYTYTAFGEEVSKTGTTENPFRYVGEKGYYFDEETADCYVRARSYKPTISRWRSKDPRFLVDGTNVYAYVLNNPTNRVDPSGRLSITVAQKPTADCGQFTSSLAWHVNADRFFEIYVIQKICFRIGVVACKKDCSGACVPDPDAKKSGEVCIFERLIRPIVGVPHSTNDEWSPPWWKQGCGTIGKVIISATIKSFGRGGVPLRGDPGAPDWKRAGEVPVGDFTVKSGPEFFVAGDTDPSWWNRNPEIVDTAFTNLVYKWDCCKKPKQEDLRHSTLAGKADRR